MIKIYSRADFKQHFNQLQQGLGDDNSALWFPESLTKTGTSPCQWFVYVQLRELNTKEQYWVWIEEHCQGTVLCYSSSHKGDWWGFENKDDIFLWTLKWVISNANT